MKKKTDPTNSEHFFHEHFFSTSTNEVIKHKASGEQFLWNRIWGSTDFGPDGSAENKMGRKVCYLWSQFFHVFKDKKKKCWK